MGALLAGAAGRPLRIVNVSSGAATRAYAGWSAYCATKAALRMAGQVVAVEADAYPPGAAGPLDLAVVTYEPGVVDTAMQAEVRATPRAAFPALDRFLELHASGRLADPASPAAEIAALLERDGGPRHEERRLNG
jgi:NAD(P)-dependent dehydrogenase (short-subunit alcohol dehydrogenase family)